jgi:hypothetical protein
MSTRGPYTAEEMIFFYLLQGTEELLPYFQKKKKSIEEFPLSEAQITDHKEPEIH